MTRMMRRISQGWRALVHRRASLEDSRRPRWIGAVGTVAAVVALPVTLQVLSEGVASAATVPTASVVSALTPFDSTANKTIAAQCPAGKRVIGGGARVNGAQHVVLTGSSRSIPAPATVTWWRRLRTRPASQVHGHSRRMRSAPTHRRVCRSSAPPVPPGRMPSRQ